MSKCPIVTPFLMGGAPILTQRHNRESCWGLGPFVELGLFL